MPLFRKVRGLWGAPGSWLHHVVLGPCGRLLGSAGRPWCSGVLGSHDGGRGPECCGPQPLGLCMDFDPFRGPSGPAVPCQALQCKPSFPCLLPAVAGGLDHLCASILEGNRLDYDPPAREPRQWLQGDFLPATERVPSRGLAKAKEGPTFPSEAKGPACGKVSGPASCEVALDPAGPPRVLNGPVSFGPRAARFSSFQANPFADPCLPARGPKTAQRCTRPPPGLSAKLRQGTSLDFSTEVSFATWAGGLLRAVLRTRTPFSAFLRSTLHLRRLSWPAQPSGDSSSRLFPLPVLHPGVFECFSIEIGSRARRRIMHRRLLRVVCMGRTLFRLPWTFSVGRLLPHSNAWSRM